jgi:transposase
MSYREVTMIEVKEVLRLWLSGCGKKRIARLLGLDVKTVRRYLDAAVACGLRRERGEKALTDELVESVMVSLRTSGERTRGETWSLCVLHREAIRHLLDQRVRLTKVRKLLVRKGVAVPYMTLYRFAVEELGFGRTATTIAVVDGEPGKELQVDTGWMTLLEPDLFGKRRRFRAWIFTAVVSRHRFVWPCFRETTETAIDACEAAWEFFGGVFAILLPDNTKTIVTRPDPLHPVFNVAFLEYAQARGFQIDATRVRSPRDKGRVERSVPTVRDDCFGGEVLQTLDDAHRRARYWCAHEYGRRRHSRTLRMPLEHFEAEERPRLLPAPTALYDVPLWCEPKVARDQYAQVAKALYSLPTRLVGRRLRARADRQTVRFYDGGKLVKTHARQPPGGRALDRSDFPEHKTAYALRDVTFLASQAAKHGGAVGRFAQVLLDGPLPWTRMRRVYALLGLARKYGDERLDEVCAIALDAEMLDVHRLGRMLQLGRPAPAPIASSPRNVIPLARYLRPPEQYALPLPPVADAPTVEDKNE